MLVDWNEGYISVCPTPDLIPVEDKNTYLPSSTWGYIRGDISEQKDLINLLTNIESGLTHDQISLLVNADDRLDSVERDIAALETSHEVDITHINTEISKKANIVDVYTKSEIDSKNYLTEHQSLTGYATESWVYSKGYLSDETDPIWSAEKHKYALKAELPSMVGYAKENWVSEQLTAKANATDVYSKTEIDGKNFITAPYLNEQLLAKANLTDVYTKVEIDGKNFITAPYLTEQLTAKANLTDVYSKIEIDGKNFAPKDWVATELLAYAKTDDVYTKTEIDGIDFATQSWVNTQLLGKANIKDVYTKAEIDGKEYITSTKLDELLLTKADTTDVYSKIEIDGKNFATQDWTTEKLLGKANTTDVYSKAEIDGKNYVNKDWVSDKLLGKANTTDVYTKTEMLSVLEGYLTPADLIGYATESWVKKQGYLTEHQSLDNYYTKSEVDTAIGNIDVDLTGYATESWVSQQGYLTEHQSLDNYYTKSEVDTAVDSKLDTNKIWTGTQDEWDALSVEQQNSYTIAMIEI